MQPCPHRHLALLPSEKPRLRCRACHLVINQDELQGFCPECYENEGKKRTDFEPVSSENDGLVRYRCEECGAIITC